ncbi:MAG: LysR family transcriptional regulator [Xanthobacteraceae bacterium]|nr:MAG: LysR family transcriptional regulator [Xanthobacteraceae bacterium]
MRVDFLGLQAFVSIADRGSFLKAAAYLNLSQTALSHRMRKLENDLGIKLLSRTTRQVALTPAGLELLPRLRRAMDELTEQCERIREQARRQQERVAIGCLPTLAVCHLPEVLRQFGELHPGVGVKVYDNSVTEIAHLVEAGMVEFGLTITATNVSDLEIKPLVKEAFVLLSPPGHRFARMKSIDWSQLAGEPMIRISPQAGNRALIDDALGNRRELLNWHYEVQHIQSAISLVQAGVGLTIMPRLAADLPGAEQLAVTGLRNPGITRTLGVISRRGLPLSPAAETLLGLIRVRLGAARRRKA